MVGVTGAGGDFWASENLSGRVHFEGYSPKWRVLSKLSVQPCYGIEAKYDCWIVHFMNGLLNQQTKSFFRE